MGIVNKGSTGARGEQIWVVDRIEEQVATVEVDGGRVMNVPISVLPKGVQEGDVFRVTVPPGGGVVGATIVADPAERERRMQASREQVRVRSDNDPGGDIVL